MSLTEGILDNLKEMVALCIIGSVAVFVIWMWPGELAKDVVLTVLGGLLGYLQGGGKSSGKKENLNPGGNA